MRSIFIAACLLVAASANQSEETISLIQTRAMLATQVGGEPFDKGDYVKALVEANGGYQNIYHLAVGDRCTVKGGIQSASQSYMNQGKHKVECYTIGAPYGQTNHLLPLEMELIHKPLQYCGFATEQLTQDSLDVSCSEEECPDEEACDHTCSADPDCGGYLFKQFGDANYRCQLQGLVSGQTEFVAHASEAADAGDGWKLRINKRSPPCAATECHDTDPGTQWMTCAKIEQSDYDYCEYYYFQTVAEGCCTCGGGQHVAVPTTAPTPIPTSPTQAPTPSPTPAPTPQPTPTPTPQPTPTPTPAPTPTPTPATPQSTPTPVKLSFGNVLRNNLGGQGPDSGKEELRFGQVAALADGTSVDLVVTTASDYSRTNKNGPKGDFCKIDQASGSSSVFTFSFEDSAQEGTAKYVENVALTFFDVDGNKFQEIKETISVCGAASFFTTADTKLGKVVEGDCTTFVPRTCDGAPNVKTVAGLTDLQKSHAFTAYMSGQSLTIKTSVSAATGKDKVERRPLLFAGVALSQ